jgi:hypothetical protein
MAEHEYTDQTLTQADLDAGKNESISEFIRCTFNGSFEDTNFGYAEFIDCVFSAAAFRRCTFIGAEGNVMPAKGLIAFAAPPASGARIDVNGRRLAKGDGSTTDFEIALVDVTNARVTVNDEGMTGGVDYTATDGQYESCNMDTGAAAPTTRAAKIAKGQAATHLDVTSSAPTLAADGVSFVTITIQKKDYQNNNTTGTETINLECALGRMEAESVNLVGGVATVKMYASTETGMGGVSAEDAAGVVRSDNVKVRLVPV